MIQADSSSFYLRGPVFIKVKFFLPEVLQPLKISNRMVYYQTTNPPFKGYGYAG